MHVFHFKMHISAVFSLLAMNFTSYSPTVTWFMCDMSTAEGRFEYILRKLSSIGGGVVRLVGMEIWPWYALMLPSKCSEFPGVRRFRP